MPLLLRSLSLYLLVAAGSSCTHWTSRTARAPYEGLQWNGREASYDGLSLVAVDPAGRWFIVQQPDARCDAEERPCDERRVGRFLKVGDAPARRIGHFLGASPDGHYVAFVEGGRARLLNTSSAREWDLSERGALTEHRSPSAPPPGVSFATDGRRVAYVRAGGVRDAVVIRDLASGEEQVLDPGPGELGFVEFDDVGSLLTLTLLVADTDGDGALRWPEWLHAHGKVQARWTQWPGFGLRIGDEPVVRVISAAGGSARGYPGFIRTFGEGVLRQDAHSSLWLETWEGVSTAWVPGACGARVLAASAIARRLVYACSKGEEPIHVELAHELARTRTAITLPRFMAELGVGRPLNSGETLVAAFSQMTMVSTGAVQRVDYQGGVIDLATGRSFLTEGEVAAVLGTSVLLRGEGRRFTLFDVARGAAVPLDLPALDHSNFSVGTLLVQDGNVIDTREQRVVGSCPGRWFALDARGRCLQYLAGEGERLDIDTQLRWTPMREDR